MQKVFLLFVLLCSMNSLAQNIVLTGRIADQNGDAVAFANVSILKNIDEKIISSKLSDENGDFSIALPGRGKFLVRVSHSSFNQFTGDYKIDSAMSLGVINMITKSNLLDNVVVVGSKHLINRKIDRLVMDVDNNALTSGRSALEVFVLAPGVFVDGGKISINGNPGTRVMVNNRMLQLSGNDLSNYLSGLRAEEIQSIEIIAHPPAEFSAEGPGGLINIMLKKNNKIGLNGSIGPEYTQGRYGGEAGNASVNFKQSKLSLFLNYSYNKSKNFQDSKFLRFIENERIDYRAITNRIDDFSRNRISTGLVYDFNDRQNISLSYTGSFSDGTAFYNSTSIRNNQAIPLTQLITGNYPRNIQTRYHNVGLNYNFQIDTLGSKLLILSDYTRNSSKTNSSGKSTFYDGQDHFIRDTSFRNSTPSQAYIFTLDANYTKAFTKASKFNLGTKLTNTTIDNSAAFEKYEEDSWIGDIGKNYIYNYREDILAGYVSFNSAVARFGYQFGLRGEYTKTSGNLKTSNLINKRDYFNLFPTVFLKYIMDKVANDYFTFYYGRRIQRPSYTNLNPYEFYADNYLVGRGNPYLNPSFTNSFEVSFVLKNKNSLALFTDLQNGLIAQYLKQSELDPLLTISTWENYGVRLNRGLVLYNSFDLQNWWKLNSNIILRRETQELQEIILKRNSATVQVNQLFSLPKKYTVNLNSTYISNRIAGNIVFSETFFLNLGLQKNFLDNNLNLKIAWNDIFNTNKMNGKIYYNDGSIAILDQVRQTQTFNISAVYKFNIGKIFKIKSIENSNEDEQGRLK